jgi:hypothetical protein
VIAKIAKVEMEMVAINDVQKPPLFSAAIRKHPEFEEVMDEDDHEHSHSHMLVIKLELVGLVPADVATQEAKKGLAAAVSDALRLREGSATVIGTKSLPDRRRRRRLLSSITESASNGVSNGASNGAGSVRTGAVAKDNDSAFADAGESVDSPHAKRTLASRVVNQPRFTATGKAQASKKKGGKSSPTTTATPKATAAAPVTTAAPTTVAALASIASAPTVPAEAAPAASVTAAEAPNPVLEVILELKVGAEQATTVKSALADPTKQDTTIISRIAKLVESSVELFTSKRLTLSAKGAFKITVMPDDVAKDERIPLNETKVFALAKQMESTQKGTEAAKERVGNAKSEVHAADATLKQMAKATNALRAEYETKLAAWDAARKKPEAADGPEKRKMAIKEARDKMDKVVAAAKQVCGDGTQAPPSAATSPAAAGDCKTLTASADAAKAEFATALHPTAAQKERMDKAKTRARASSEAAQHAEGTAKAACAQAAAVVEGSPDRPKLNKDCETAKASQASIEAASKAAAAGLRKEEDTVAEFGEAEKSSPASAKAAATSPTDCSNSPLCKEVATLKKKLDAATEALEASKADLNEAVEGEVQASTKVQDSARAAKETARQVEEVKKQPGALRETKDSKEVRDFSETSCMKPKAEKCGLDGSMVLHGIDIASFGTAQRVKFLDVLAATMVLEQCSFRVIKVTSSDGKHAPPPAASTSSAATIPVAPFEGKAGTGEEAGGTITHMGHRHGGTHSEYGSKALAIAQGTPQSSSLPAGSLLETQETSLTAATQRGDSNSDGNGDGDSDASFADAGDIAPKAKDATKELTAAKGTAALSYTGGAALTVDFELWVDGADLGGADDIAGTLKAKILSMFLSGSKGFITKLVRSGIKGVTGAKIESASNIGECKIGESTRGVGDGATDDEATAARQRDHLHGGSLVPDYAHAKNVDKIHAIKQADKAAALTKKRAEVIRQVVLDHLEIKTHAALAALARPLKPNPPTPFPTQQTGGRSGTSGTRGGKLPGANATDAVMKPEKHMGPCVIIVHPTGPDQLAFKNECQEAYMTFDFETVGATAGGSKQTATGWTLLPNQLSQVVGAAKATILQQKEFARLRREPRSANKDGCVTATLDSAAATESSCVIANKCSYPVKLASPVGSVEKAVVPGQPVSGPTTLCSGPLFSLGHPTKTEEATEETTVEAEEGKENEDTEDDPTVHMAESPSMVSGGASDAAAARFATAPAVSLDPDNTASLSLTPGSGDASAVDADATLAFDDPDPELAKPRQDDTTGTANSDARRFALAGGLVHPLTGATRVLEDAGLLSPPTLVATSPTAATLLLEMRVRSQNTAKGPEGKEGKQTSAPEGKESKTSAPEGKEGKQTSAPEGKESKTSAPEGKEGKTSAPEGKESKTSAPEGKTSAPEGKEGTVLGANEAAVQSIDWPSLLKGEELRESKNMAGGVDASVPNVVDYFIEGGLHLRGLPGPDAVTDALKTSIRTALATRIVGVDSTLVAVTVGEAGSVDLAQANALRATMRGAEKAANASEVKPDGSDSTLRRRRRLGRRLVSMEAVASRLASKTSLHVGSKAAAKAATATATAPALSPYGYTGVLWATADPGLAVDGTAAAVGGRLARFKRAAAARAGLGTGNHKAVTFAEALVAKGSRRPPRPPPPPPPPPRIITPPTTTTTTTTPTTTTTTTTVLGVVGITFSIRMESIDTGTAALKALEDMSKSRAAMNELEEDVISGLKSTGGDAAATANLLRGLSLTKPALKGVPIPQMSKVAVNIEFEVRSKDMNGLMIKEWVVGEIKGKPDAFAAQLRYLGARDARYIQMVAQPELVMLMQNGKEVSLLPNGQPAPPRRGSVSGSESESESESEKGRGSKTPIEPEEDEDQLDDKNAFDRLGFTASHRSPGWGSNYSNVELQDDGYPAPEGYVSVNAGKAD